MESTEKITYGGSAAEAVHYRRMNPQPIEIMQSLLTKQEMLGFLHGNIIKYALRCGFKGVAAQDMEKIIQYAKWYITVCSGEIINPNE